MAQFTPSQIIESRDRQRLPVSERVRTAQDTTQGLTDELSNSRFMKVLGAGAPAYLEESVWEEEPNVPTLDVVLSKLGIKADDDPTGIKAARKFVDEFSNKHDAWKKKITNDPAWGERGWETVKDLFKKTSNDLMNYDIKEGRKKIASGEDEEGFDWLQTKAANLVFPRAVKAVEEGRDPTGGEWARDIASNALYAVPFGGVAKSVAPASKILQYGSQAVAPATVATIDYASDPTYTASDAAISALSGTGANLGVNKWLAPKLGQMLGTAKGSIARRVPRAVREALEDKPTNQVEADAIVNRAKQILNPPQKSKSEIASEIASGATKGVSEDEANTALAIKDIYDASKQKMYGSSPSNILKVLAESQNHPQLTQKEVASMVGELVASSRKPFKGRSLTNSEEVSEALKQFNADKSKYSKVLEDYPALLSLFTKQPIKASFTPTNMLKTYVVNKIGSSNPEIARGSVSALTGGSVDLNKLSEGEAKARAKSDARGAVSKILSASPDVTEEDAKYLEMVRKNPDVLKFSQDDGFKQWLLRRGHSILSGTPAHRPIWEVK